MAPRGHLGIWVFRPPGGSYWDFPLAFKALPRAASAAPARPPKLQELRNFAEGVHRHLGGAATGSPVIQGDPAVEPSHPAVNQWIWGW